MRSYQVRSSYPPPQSSSTGEPWSSSPPQGQVDNGELPNPTADDLEMVVLTKLRQRYADSNEAAVAAFQLGRLSSDGQLAASWFRNSLMERPHGELAREASGRLIEALDRAGDRMGARSAAESYLARYPSGPHASFARSITSP